MYTLIIIDDESIIRNGLKKFVDWKSLNIEVIELFEDGKEAIEFLKYRNVDIVLSDIKMNEITGLDVAKFVYETKTAKKMVLLSGYKEFEYARQAIEYKVEHYLLKPTNFPKIHEVFQRLVYELDQENASDEVLPQVREQFFNDLIMGGIRRPEWITKRAKILSMEWQLEKQCAVIEYIIEDFEVFIDTCWTYGRERLHVALGNIFNDEKGNIGFHQVYNDQDSFLVFAYSEHNAHSNFLQDIESCLEDIKESIRIFLGGKMKVNNIETYVDMYALGRESDRIHQYKDINNQVEQFEAVDIDFYQQVTRKYKLFYSKLNDGSYEEIVELVEGLFDELQEYPIHFAHKIIIDLFGNLSNKFSMIGLDIVSMTDGLINYKHILEMNSYGQLKEYLLQCLQGMSQYRNAQEQDSSELVIEKAIRYIYSHFHEDLSLEDVANQVYLNPVYFCRFFKQKTHENFTDFLTKIRMERATELIRTGKYKNYEISEMVGYKSSKYFSRVFRQFTGMTPTEYGKQ